MKKLMVVILITLIGWNLQTAQAQKPGVVLKNDPGWQKIGETEASFQSQDESIAVIGADEFEAIKIRVEEAPLQIERLQVFYESGDMEEIDVKQKMNPGDESKIFNLEKPTRDIQKVAFTYHTVSNSEGDKADIELYGLKTDRQSSEAYRDKARREADETGDEIRRESTEAKEDIERQADETGKDVERAADKSGNRVSEAAGNVAADIDDPKLENKVGPDGQTVYQSDDSRYYYVNKKGKRVYVSWSRLKDKPEGDN